MRRFAPLDQQDILFRQRRTDFLIWRCVSLKPVNSGGHSAYQNRVLVQLRKYYPDAAASLPSSTWQILEKFWALDLSAIDSLMQDRYSVFDPEPRLPSDMLRAILVSVAFKITSYTRFASHLKENLLLVIISGFPVGATPGVGTFYDFHKRLWLSGNKNLSYAIHPPKQKPQKPQGKEEKAAPVEKVTVEELFRQSQENPPSEMAPCARLWEIFHTFSFRLLWTITLSPSKSLHWLGMAPLFILPRRSARPVPATAFLKAAAIADVTAFTISPTVTLVGIPIADVITLDTTYTC